VGLDINYPSTNYQQAQHLMAAQDSIRFSLLYAIRVSKEETIGGPPPADELLFLV
jgi:hypothetical protein